MVTWPMDSWMPGVGMKPDVAPQPAMVSTAPVGGTVSLRPSGLTFVTDLDSRARAMSVMVDCRTSTTNLGAPGGAVSCPSRSGQRPGGTRRSPPSVDSVAVVAYGGGPLTGTRLTSWKQCPAVMIQVGEISAAEQALLYHVPSGRGMWFMVNFTANGYWPGAAGVPSATAAAGFAPRTAAVHTAAMAIATRTNRVGCPPIDIINRRGFIGPLATFLRFPRRDPRGPRHFFRDKAGMTRPAPPC